MSIRVHKKTRFTTISNDLINNKALSWEARSVLIYLLSKPEGWIIRSSDLVNQSPAGRDKVAKILKELGENQYLYRWSERVKGGRFEWRSEVFESPKEMKEWVEEQGGLPVSANQNGKTVNGKSATNQNGKTVNGRSVNGRTVNGKGVSLVNLDLTNPELINTDLEKKDLDPERGREEFFEEEVVSGEFVSESEPKRSDFVVKKAKDSGSDLEILREGQIAAAPKKSREATERADNLQEAQLRRKGIDPIDYNRFRAIYAPYVNGVTQYGFGSDEYAHREWLNLQRNGWVADADFWRGLELESIWGLELYRKTKTPIPGVPGGAAFLSSRRWEQAIERNAVNEKLKSVDLEMHVEKPKELRLSDSISKMNEVANRVIDRILARDQETQLLEASHDF